jgi:hypothetical protein
MTPVFCTHLDARCRSGGGRLFDRDHLALHLPKLGGCLLVATDKESAGADRSGSQPAAGRRAREAAEAITGN